MLHEQFIFIDSSQCAGPFGAYSGLGAGVFPSIASQTTTLQTRRHATYARLPPQNPPPSLFPVFPPIFFLQRVCDLLLCHIFIIPIQTAGKGNWPLNYKFYAWNWEEG